MKVQTTWMVLLAALGLVACESDVAEEVEGSDGAETEVVEMPPTSNDPDLIAAEVDPAMADAWLGNRYGVPSGTIVVDLELSGSKTRQVRYFRDNGRTEAMYTYVGGEDSKPAVGVLMNDTLEVRGPADERSILQPWRHDGPSALPNFNNLTQEMRDAFQMEDLETREFLGKEAKGYRLKSGELISSLWVWEGIILYGEVGAAADLGVEPMIHRVVSLDTETPIADEKFVIE